MSSFIPFSRDQAFLMPPDLKSWLPEGDVAHFVVAAVERVPLRALAVPGRTGGKPQYHPRLMLALLIHRYANGIFSSRRIELATYRDVGVRFVAANLHPDHDTVSAFRRTNAAAIEAAFLHVLLLAREAGLLRLGTVSIDDTKIDADASKIRSVCYDRATALRARLAADIAAMTAQAEAADAANQDPQALLPAELARPAYEAKKAVYDARTGRRGRPPKPPDDAPPPERQSNLTDPDSALTRRSYAHEYRQAYNAQAVVCAEGTQLIVATNLVATTADAPSFAATILAMERTVGLPRTVLADTGYAGGPAVADLQARGIEPLVAIGRTQIQRPYDFRPPTPPRTPRRITEPWRLVMKAKLDRNDARTLYKRRKQTVEPAFGIIKSTMGFTRFHLRGIHNVTAEWTLVALAYNCRRLNRLLAA